MPRAARAPWRHGPMSRASCPVRRPAWTSTGSRASSASRSAHGKTPRAMYRCCCRTRMTAERARRRMPPASQNAAWARRTEQRADRCCLATARGSRAEGAGRSPRTACRVARQRVAAGEADRGLRDAQWVSRLFEVMRSAERGGCASSSLLDTRDGRSAFRLRWESLHHERRSRVASCPLWQRERAIDEAVRQTA